MKRHSDRKARSSLDPYRDHAKGTCRIARKYGCPGICPLFYSCSARPEKDVICVNRLADYYERKNNPMT
jgi:hypothetical protein